jgi:hypothetical protein
MFLFSEHKSEPESSTGCGSHWRPVGAKRLHDQGRRCRVQTCDTDADTRRPLAAPSICRKEVSEPQDLRSSVIGLTRSKPARSSTWARCRIRSKCVAAACTRSIERIQRDCGRRVEIWSEIKTTGSSSSCVLSTRGPMVFPRPSHSQQSSDCTSLGMRQG